MFSERANASSASDADAADEQAAFVRLLSGHQRLLYGYLVNLLGNLNDAEDVLQETVAVLWQKRAEFAPGTNFGAWACRVGFLQVQRWRREQQRGGIPLGDELLDQIAEEGAERWSLGAQRREALSRCLQKLPVNDRHTVAAIYGSGVTISQAAEQLRRPVGGVYKGIQRIRRALLECIERAIRLEEQE